MKKYRFEFDKFVKDLEKREGNHRKRLAEEACDLDEQQLKRELLKRYHEHQHNSVVYKTRDKS